MLDPALDQFLGESLSRRGWIRAEDLERCLARQAESRESSGPGRSLGEIAIELGLVTRDQIDDFVWLECQKELLREDIVLGLLAVRSLRIRREQFQECLDAQKELTRARKAPVPHLFDLLIEKGYATRLDHLAALRGRKALAARPAPRPSTLATTGASPAPTPPPSSALALAEENLVGRVFDGLEILEKIASGGMGTVYRAEQLSLDRIVAIKVLKPRFSNDSQYIERFLREAKAAARLCHGNIVQIFDVGQHEGLYYIVMEYVDGRSLYDIVRLIGPLPPDRAADCTIQGARALDAGSRAGIVHKDLKPENVLVNRYGDVKIADYGLARITDFETAIYERRKIAGTVTYMSPEQIESKPLDIRSDIYSLGITLFEVLTGHPPFGGKEAMEIAMAHLKSPPPTLAHLSVPIPQGLYEILCRMLEKDPDRRYANPVKLIEALDGFLRDYAVSRPRRKPPRPAADPAAITAKRKRRN